MQGISRQEGIQKGRTIYTDVDLVSLSREHLVRERIRSGGKKREFGENMKVRFIRW